MINQTKNEALENKYREEFDILWSDMESKEGHQRSPSRKWAFRFFIYACRSRQEEIKNLDQEIYKLKAEIEVLKFERVPVEIFNECEKKIKSLKQENERLKKFFEDQCGESYENLTTKAEEKAMVHLERRVVQDAFKDQLKERDELIREAVGLITSNPLLEKSDYKWLGKARKLLEEK